MENQPVGERNNPLSGTQREKMRIERWNKTQKQILLRSIAECSRERKTKTAYKGDPAKEIWSVGNTSNHRTDST